ncbi:hypothetical protein LTR17_011226 [Elasticomyces elasticus]|nr:hypothetical protein LTR17_011226 [Elasticomyces elasticus]
MNPPVTSSPTTRAAVDNGVPLGGVDNATATQVVGQQAQTALEKPLTVHDSQDSAQTGDDTVYPGRLAFWVIYTGLLLATFVIGFDSNCVATIIPVITDEFHSLNDVGWYGTAYLITSASTLVAYGKIYKYYPAKRVYLIALSVYILGSIVCATAPSSLAFIIGRAVAGLGSAGLIAGGKVVVTRILPMHLRPLYQGYIGGVESVAIAIGPLIGGALTLASSWRAVFYISIPIGVINGVGLLLLGNMPDIPTPEATTRRERLRALDLPSVALLVPCVVCLVLALTWAGAQYAWSNFRVIVTLTLSGILALIFALLQYYKNDSATLPPRILTQRSIAFSSMFSFCNSACLFVLTYYLPIYFQAIRGANTLTSGVMSLPLVGGLIIASLGAGHLTTRIGYYTPSMIASSVFTSVGTGLITTLSVHSSVATWTVFQLLAGLGCGLGFQQPYVAAQKAVNKPDVPTALVVVGFAQRLGNIVCLAAAQYVFTSRLVANLRRGVPQVDPTVVLNTGATSLRTSVADMYEPAVLKAYSVTLARVFQIAVVLSCLAMVGALGIEWKSVKKVELQETALRAISTPAEEPGEHEEK